MGNVYNESPDFKEVTVNGVRGYQVWPPVNATSKFNSNPNSRKAAKAARKARRNTR